MPLGRGLIDHLHRCSYYPHFHREHYQYCLRRTESQPVENTTVSMLLRAFGRKLSRAWSGSITFARHTGWSESITAKAVDSQCFSQMVAWGFGWYKRPRAVQ